MLYSQGNMGGERANAYGGLANPNIVKERGRGNQTKKFTFDI